MAIKSTLGQVKIFKQEAQRKRKNAKYRINCSDKGKRGERQFAEYLRERGFNARRGQQFAGGTDSPDVKVKDLPAVHWEVKFTHALPVYDYIEQAKRDAQPWQHPIVAYKRNRMSWVAMMPMDEMIILLRRLQLNEASALVPAGLDPTPGALNLA